MFLTLYLVNLKAIIVFNLINFAILGLFLSFSYQPLLSNSFDISTCCYNCRWRHEWCREMVRSLFDTASFLSFAGYVSGIPRRVEMMNAKTSSYSFTVWYILLRLAVKLYLISVCHSILMFSFLLWSVSTYEANGGSRKFHSMEMWAYFIPFKY